MSAESFPFSSPRRKGSPPLSDRLLTRPSFRPANTFHRELHKSRRSVSKPLKDEGGIVIGSAHIEELKSKRDALMGQARSHLARAAGLLELGRLNRSKLAGYFESFLKANAGLVRGFFDRAAVHDVADWNDPRWTAWNPEEAADVLTLQGPLLVSERSRIRVGDLQEHSNGELTFQAPAYAPFIGQKRTVIIRTSAASADLGLSLLQSLLIRTALLLPHQSSYLLLDPAGQGRAFPMQRYLPQVQEGSGDVRRDLEVVLQQIQRIYATYLDANIPTFEMIEPELRVNERFHFVFAADFPFKYDRRAIDTMQDVSRTGPDAGCYLFLHHNTSHDLPRDLSMNGFSGAFLIDLDRVTQEAYLLPSMRLFPDAGERAIHANLQNLLFDKLRSAKKIDKEIGFEQYVGLPEEDWWKQTSRTSIETSVGSTGSRESLTVTFGQKADGSTCAHGVIAAMTGSGKSNLYHVIILGLCLRYSPEELSLYLIDGKNGIEFRPYRNLPHAAVVSLHSPPELSRSVLSDLIEEMEYRNTVLFKGAGPDVTDFERYYAFCESAAPQARSCKKIPRILLLVDEYQELFEGDRDGIASTYILRLAQQGRSSGIHMLLGSQRFGAPGMLNQTAIFSNIHLRMAMQMTDSDARVLAEFARRGKQLIQACDLPGKIVINDRSGDDAGNVTGKVAFFKKSEVPGEKDLREQLISRLKAKSESDGNQGRATIVFDGIEQPLLMENPFVADILARSDCWPSPVEAQQFARRTIQEGGLGVPDWHAAEAPILAWLGQEFAVRGQARLMLRRRVTENALVVGGVEAARYGMLTGILASLALTSPPTALEFRILDRSIPETSWSDALEKIVQSILNVANFKFTYVRGRDEAEELLSATMAELADRRQSSERELLARPSIVVLMTELDRVEAFRRPTSAYGMAESPQGEGLLRLFAEGPPVGIHSILSFSGVRPLCSVVDERRGLVNFRHRVGLQMSEDESLIFVRGREAARLQLDAPRPVCAVYQDTEYDKKVRFKPYSIESDGYLDQIEEIGRRIQAWRVQ